MNVLVSPCEKDNVSTDVFISAQWHSNSSLPDRLLVHYVDFWQKTKSVVKQHSFPEMSEPCGRTVSVQEACLSRVCVVFSSPYRHASGSVLSGQDTPLLKQACSKCPWLSTHEAWLTTLWHAAMLESIQRKLTKSISLIRASGILPSKPWCVIWPCPAGLCLVWPGPGWWLCGTECRNRWVLSQTPTLFSYRLAFSLCIAHKRDRKHTHSNATAEGRIWQPSKIIITVGTLTWHHMIPWSSGIWHCAVENNAVSRHVSEGFIKSTMWIFFIMKIKTTLIPIREMPSWAPG